MAIPPQVTVEFFGMARRRAGRPALELRAATVADALAVTMHECPDIGPLLAGDALAPQFLASINAGPFLNDLSASLSDGDRVLVLSADAGG